MNEKFLHLTRGSMISAWMIIGAGFGVALGILFDSIPLGIGVGLSIGVAVGIGLENVLKGNFKLEGHSRKKQMVLIGTLILVLCLLIMGYIFVVSR